MITALIALGTLLAMAVRKFTNKNRKGALTLPTRHRYQPTGQSA